MCKKEYHSMTDFLNDDGLNDEERDELYEAIYQSYEYYEQLEQEKEKEKE